MRGRVDLFENSTSNLELVVQVTIEAAVSVAVSDVRVQTSDREDVAPGSLVIVGDTLTVTVSAFDYERLPIARSALQLLAELSGVTKNAVPVQHHDGNTYRAVLPSSWIGDPGEYTLRVDGFEITKFTVTKTNQSLIVAGGIVGVCTLPLGPFCFVCFRSLACVILLRNICSDARAFGP